MKKCRVNNACRVLLLQRESITERSALNSVRRILLICVPFSIVNYVIKIKRTQMKPEGKAEDNRKKRDGNVLYAKAFEARFLDQIFLGTFFQRP